MNLPETPIFLSNHIQFSLIDNVQDNKTESTVMIDNSPKAVILACKEQQEIARQLNSQTVSGDDPEIQNLDSRKHGKYC